MNEHQLNALGTLMLRNSGYLARQEMRQLFDEIKAQDTKQLRLEPFGFKVYSQADEDGILEEIFKRLGIEAGTFLEIGVENGLECNSLYLLHKHWRGWWVEQNRDHADFMRKTFLPLLTMQRLGVNFSFVYPHTFAEVFERSGFCSEKIADSGGLDLLSIDIDGNDIYLLKSLEHVDKAYWPKVICIEYNAKFPAHVSKKPVYNPKHKWQGTDFMGSSLLALAEEAIALNYHLVGTNAVGSNAFFVRGDVLNDQFIRAREGELRAHVAALYNPPRYHWVRDHFLLIGHPADFGEYVDLMYPPHSGEWSVPIA